MLLYSLSGRFVQLFFKEIQAACRDAAVGALAGYIGSGLLRTQGAEDCSHLAWVASANDYRRECAGPARRQLNLSGPPRESAKAQLNHLGSPQHRGNARRSTWPGNTKNRGCAEATAPIPDSYRYSLISGVDATLGRPSSVRVGDKPRTNRGGSGQCCVTKLRLA